MSQFATYEDLLAAITVDEGREIINPATEEVVGVAPEGSVEELNAAVERAVQAQKSFAKLSDAERCDLLLKAADAIEASAEPLVELLSREQGKPLKGPNARFEVGACSAWLRATASFESPDYTAVDDDITATVHYRPLGVVGAIGPWNWPMMITIWQIAPALRMGNAVVVKPSEYTPLSVLALIKVFNSVLPEGVLQVVTGDGAVGAALTTHADIDKIMFTGSTATGKKIVESSAANLQRLTLELGGNDAGIVLDDADPAAIAGDLFWGAFINTGQTCAAMKRLYVPESLYDAVCEALVEVAKASPMGVGLEEENVLGPLQNKQQFDIVDKLVNAAKDSGARVLLGGDPDYDAPGYFYPTTLVADIDPDNALVVEEQFGPALPIVKYTDLDWAIEQANKLDVGLGSSVWSSNRERALEVAAQLEAGTTWINSHGAVDPRVPFGGIKSSGYGVEFGTEGLKGLAYPQIING
ncbi:aldehyde dehydrogenase family protein [Corynebacterium striatum]|uniref:aldehyde dehydrogenase family protein n=1 Tax=Corynebacterium striatum TaxID=43770 RepID=UPI00141A533C|nr:aldehyde dehydrogenase family protein [Corynebacterium striatum]NHY11368.1 aldehyde dehydrogenase family protein [Corynebacterium striatum]NHY35202.1 aldehyde dehydrogenase family protein [Corynebacterium striatum]QRP19485.1 aldehyde dehydrogenase family protein [Corynebacterium striatum]HAT1131672.1 aldehyde dehydrogenase family protein [Corynebacterium striatum]HAT1136411.1 aldehyde dehydrogenase family protein [Corynebacterium striatum]